MNDMRLQTSVCRTSVVLVGVVAALGTPSLAIAGDSTIYAVRGSGLGDIDGHILIYAGSGRAVVTPFPSPPQGPLWSVVYQAGAILGGTAAALAVVGHLRTARSAHCTRDDASR